MGKQLTWLSDAVWARIEPLLALGRCRARRADDRRVISGIVHMLQIGARWLPGGVRVVHDDLQLFSPLEPAMRVVRGVRGVYRA